MEGNDEKRPIIDATSLAINLSASGATGLVGFFLGGPVGAFIGGAAGPLITKVFDNIGEEFLQRHLGSREKDRMGKVLFLATEKMVEKYKAGQSIRDNSFFINDKSGRPPAEEILEAILLSSQKTYEELKLPFIGNLYANICMTEVDKAFANLLVRLADRTSYRQLCLLQWATTNETLNQDEVDRQGGAWGRYFDSKELLAEIRELQNWALINIQSFMDDNDKTAPLGIVHVRISENGTLLSQMMELDQIPSKDLDSIVNLIRVHEK